MPQAENVKTMEKCLVCCVRDHMINQFLLNLKKNTHILDRVERKNQESRADDKEEIAIKRYKTYEKSTEPVIDYYKNSNLLNVINGEASIDEISDEISGIIEGIKG